MNNTSCFKFSDAFDLYLAACSNKEALTDSLKEFLYPYKGRSILDCSVGTGFATLDLIKDGFNIVCSDGSGQMLDKFSENAKRLEVDTRPIMMKWEDLGSAFSGVFDVVICRGNSLVYADMWDSEQAVDTRSTIERSLKSMYRCARTGGVLYIDIPAGPSLSRSDPMSIKHPMVKIDGISVSVSERIQILRDGKTREWNVAMSIEGDTFSFTRYSHLISEEDLTKSLLSIGFKDIKPLKQGGHRDHYQAFIARKP